MCARAGPVARNAPMMVLGSLLKAQIDSSGGTRNCAKDHSEVKYLGRAAVGTRLLTMEKIDVGFEAFDGEGQGSPPEPP